MRTITIVLALFILNSGCVGIDQKPTSLAAAPSPSAERYILPPVQKKLPLKNEGTIFSEQSQNIYQDRRAKSIGDIILVKIVETSSGTKNAETSTSRDTSLTGGVSSLFGYENKLFSNSGSHTPSLTSLNSSLTKSFEGKGETKRDSNVTATISARIVDQTIDGNLVIRGYREIRVNNETQHIILSGLVRPDDVQKDNSVLSSYIADARIEYSGNGPINDRQQPGWLSSLIDVAWPF